MTYVNKHYNSIIKKNKWLHLCIQLKSEKHLLLLIKNYSFCKLDLNGTEVIDNSVSLLTNLNTLNLGYTKVTDNSVSFLTNLHTLCLNGTEVTDKSVSLLTNLHTLNLSYTKVTDKSVSLLTNLHTLVKRETNNTKVTNECKDFLRSKNVIIKN